MLVSRRRAAQSLFIGDDIEIKIVEIGPAWVRLGIAAPRHLAVTRSEQRLTRNENLEAAAGLALDHLPEFLEALKPCVSAAPHS